MVEAILITGGSVAFLILIDFIISFKKYKKIYRFGRINLKLIKQK